MGVGAELERGLKQTTRPLHRRRGSWRRFPAQCRRGRWSVDERRSRSCESVKMLVGSCTFRHTESVCGEKSIRDARVHDGTNYLPG